MQLDVLFGLLSIMAGGAGVSLGATFNGGVPVLSVVSLLLGLSILAIRLSKKRE